MVEQPLCAEKEHPGIGADEEARPERDDDEAEEEVLPAPRRAESQGIRDRIADHQSERGGQQSHPEGAPTDPEIDLLERAGVALQEGPGGNVAAQVLDRLQATVDPTLPKAQNERQR